MFEAVFKWFDSPSLTLNMPHTSVSLSLCVTAKKNISEQLQLARRAYHALRFATAQDADALKNSLTALQQLERYLKFIETCETYLQKEQTLPIDLLLLKIVLAHAQMHKHAHTVFDAWLKHDPVLALQFYEEYLIASLQVVDDETQNESAVVGMGVVCVRYFLENLKASIQHQTAPLALCQLSLAFLDTPLRFIACVIWMLEQGASVDLLIRSGILHQYVGYYFPNFGAVDKPLNVVSLLYKLLDQFEVAKILIEDAALISCDVRGFKRINLLGQNVGGLLSIEKINHSPLLTRTPDNLKQLVDVFGEHGLVVLIDELFHSSEDDFDAFFTQYMHNSNALLTPSLLHKTAEDKPANLFKLACFFDDPLFQQWISEDKFSILFLLPFKPQWIQFIDGRMMAVFLQSLDTDHSPGSELESAKLFLSLYQATLPVNTALAEQVFQTLFQFILIYRYLLDDKLVFFTLKHSPYLSHFVEIEAAMLTHTLVEQINHFILDEETLFEYQDLVSQWQCLLGRFEILGLLKKLSSPFPVTRALFIVFLFEQNALHLVKSWDFLFHVTQLTSDFEPDLNEYHREILLKLLTHIDNRELRDMIFARLNLNEDFFLENGRKVLLNGIANKNIGLLNDYLARHPLEDDLLQQATVFQQWPMISIWLKECGFADKAQEVIDFLLIEVSGSKNTQLLRALIKDADLQFSAHTIAKAVAKASGADDPIALNYLYLLKPLPMTLKAVVSQAIKEHHYKSLSFFKRFKKHNEHLAQGILQAFNIAVKNNDMPMVSTLMAFSTNAPTRAMVKAAKNGIEDRAMKNAAKMNKTSKKTKASEPIVQHSTADMIQLLEQHLKTVSPAQLKRSKLPPSKSFRSTDSLVAAGSSIFASPLGLVPTQHNVWGTENLPPQSPPNLNQERELSHRGVIFTGALAVS
ncbi:MAG: hypothetical protein NTW08_04385 [Gammaproteobacteria bacterium]|nr:hypothetical protein [Gammaproteobacteria bacterium]